MKKTKSTRLLPSLGLALALGFTFLPAGCGGGQPPPMTSTHRAEGSRVPEATVAALNACAMEAQEHLTETTYAVRFDVAVGADGQARSAKVKDSYPEERVLEQCMARALEAMVVPRRVMDEAVRQSRKVSPESRGLAGQPEDALKPLIVLLGGSIELGPVFVVIAGVTIIVGVAVIAVEVVDAATKRPRWIEKKCQDDVVRCLENPWQPEWNQKNFGKRKNCTDCQQMCLNHEKGEWPIDKCPP